MYTRLGPGSDGIGGWRYVVDLDMSNPSTTCPESWKPKQYSKKTCGKSSDRTTNINCDSANFPVSGGQYTQASVARPMPTSEDTGMGSTYTLVAFEKGLMSYTRNIAVENYTCTCGFQLQVTTCTSSKTGGARAVYLKDIDMTGVI